MQNIYQFAGHVVEIHSLYDQVHRMCADYRADGMAPEYRIVITEEDILEERQKSEREDLLEGIPIRHFSEKYLETLAVYRKMAEFFLAENILLFHGSAICVDGEAYLFTAKSGTGKSTHVRLWEKQFGDRAVIINDDKPLLKIEQDGVTVYGTPWDGKEHRSTNTSCPLKAICVLTRSETNQIKPIDKKTAFFMLCQQSYRSPHPDALKKVLHLVDQLSRSVALYQLGCNMEPEAARVAYDGMNS